MGRTQRVIAETISKELKLDRSVGKRFLQRVIDLIADDIVFTGRFELRGVGIFYTTRRPAVHTIHPATGKPVLIPEKKILRFRSSAAIRRRLNTLKKKKPPVKKAPRR